MRSRIAPALAAAALTSVTGLLSAGPAAGDRTGIAFIEDEGVQSGVSDSGGRPSRSGGQRPTCSYEKLDIPGTTVYDSNGDPVVPTGPGAWFTKACTSAAGEIRNEIIFVSPRDPADVAAEAKRRLVLPAPTIITSPPADDLLIVNFPTWLAVDSSTWRVQGSTVSVPGVSVTVEAVPKRVIWNTGDGEKVVCDGPGKTYNPAIPDDQQTTNCSHTFRRTSAREAGRTFPLTATIEWHARWSASGAPGGGDLGIVRRTSRPVAVRVGEVQTINTPSRSRR